jgi:serine/threonine protein kinase
VKVLDFGLAKLAKLPASADLSSASRASQSSTDAGVVLGTVRYMSPEQARGLKADARADVWSLGVVLYEIVAGKAPFEGVNTFEVVAAILEREPLPLRQHNADVPDEIQRIVSKALQKDREERYQTANDLLLDLKSLKEELALRAKLARSTRKEIDGRQRSVAASGERVVQVGESDKTRATSNAKQLISGIKQPNRGVALGLAALILIGAGTVFVLYRLISQRQARPGANNQPVAPLQTMQIRRLTNTGNITTAAISPDGKYVAYAVRDGGQQSLWLRQVEITSNVQITPSTEDDVAGLTFSHNGNY